MIARETYSSEHIPLGCVAKRLIEPSRTINHVDDLKLMFMQCVGRSSTTIIHDLNIQQHRCERYVSQPQNTSHRCKSSRPTLTSTSKDSSARLRTVLATHWSVKMPVHITVLMPIFASSSRRFVPVRAESVVLQIWISSSPGFSSSTICASARSFGNSK